MNTIHERVIMLTLRKMLLFRVASRRLAKIQTKLSLLNGVVTIIPIRRQNIKWFIQSSLFRPKQRTHYKTVETKH